MSHEYFDCCDLKSLSFISSFTNCLTIKTKENQKREKAKNIMRTIPQQKVESKG